MVKSEEEEDDIDDEEAADDEDMNNGGSHINDNCNIKEKDGRVLVNLSHPTADPDIYLPINISDHIKPHQVGFVQKMKVKKPHIWDRKTTFHMSDIVFC